jgi:Flp pilus assembly protein CpaB
VHSTKYPNQTFNEDKNENDKKVFRQMQTKISFKSISNPENVKQSKTLTKSKGFLSIKHSDLDPEIISFFTKIKNKKTFEMTKKEFQTLKTNQQTSLKLRKQSDTSTKLSSQVIKEKNG